MIPPSTRLVDDMRFALPTAEKEIQEKQWKKSYSFDGIPYGRMSKKESFSKKLVREVIGESIPPLAMMKMVEHIKKIEKEHL